MDCIAMSILSVEHRERIPEYFRQGDTIMGDNKNKNAQAPKNPNQAPKAPAPDASKNAGNASKK
jgi:hypothetical protein